MAKVSSRRRNLKCEECGRRNIEYTYREGNIRRRSSRNKEELQIVSDTQAHVGESKASRTRCPIEAGSSHWDAFASNEWLQQNTSPSLFGAYPAVDSLAASFPTETIGTESTFYSKPPNLALDPVVRVNNWNENH
ncbi:hypothetical protein B0H13DRAFT_1855935 [Mycena leptocephala]|nr:hypothetical protein B0H13DRAFT_1855935 [Mycena leptocephala]